jgi:hypothetical protein
MYLERQRERLAQLAMLLSVREELAAHTGAASVAAVGHPVILWYTA